MINYIFGFFLVIGIIYGFIFNNISSINSVLVSGGKDAIDMIFNIIPLLCLWLGVMKIAEESGLIKKISLFMSKIIHPIFPDLDEKGNSISYIATNMVMNMLGLGSGATPFGLKAMKSMQDENGNKNVASRSMITFLVINTASVTIIPTTVISFRMFNNSSNPTDIVLACVITTVLSCIIGLLLDRLFYYIWKCKYD